MIAQSTKRRFQELKNEAERFKSTWKDICAYMLPTCGSFDEKPDDKITIDHLKILDCDPNMYLTWLAAAMMSGMTNPSREWFALGTDKNVWGETPEEAEYLKKRKSRIENRMHTGNLYMTFLKMYLELPAVGTYVFLLEADPVTGIRTIPFTIGETYLGMGPRGQIDTFGRKFYMTPYEMAAEFGDKCPPHIRRRAEDARGGNERIAVCQLIEPNNLAQYGKTDARNMPYRSVYWTDGYDDYLRVSGYRRFPVICPRWDVKHFNTVWGVGPGWNVLGAVKSLQKITADENLAVEMGLKPPVQAPSSMQGRLNLRPGGISYTGIGIDCGVKPVYQANMDIAKAELLVGKIKNQIKSQFYGDVFLMLLGNDKTGKTATEIAEKSQEKLMVMGPVLERLTHEALRPVVEIIDGINEQNGEYDDLVPPESLQGRELKITFNSIFHEAQKASGTRGMQQLLEFFATLQPFKPDTPDWLDGDKMARLAGEKLSSSELLADEDSVNALRKERAQAQAAAAQMQQAQESAALAQSLAKAGTDAGEIDKRGGY